MRLEDRHPRFPTTGATYSLTATGILGKRLQIPKCELPSQNMHVLLIPAAHSQ